MIYDDNVILGEYKEFIIVRNEIGMLFYFNAEGAKFEPETIIEGGLLNPITELSEEQQKEINYLFLE